MTLPETVTAILDANAPVLCLDTCSLLDVIRTPKRRNVTATEREA